MSGEQQPDFSMIFDCRTCRNGNRTPDPECEGCDTHFSNWAPVEKTCRTCRWELSRPYDRPCDDCKASNNWAPVEPVTQRSDEAAKAIDRLAANAAALNAQQPNPIEPIDQTDWHVIATQIADLVAEKNAAYGDSFSKSNQILTALYPKGIAVSQYHDALAVVRVVDKLFRIATRKNAFGESPWRDVCGYALLSAAKDEDEREF